MLWAGHPNEPMYAEIARDVLATVLNLAPLRQQPGSRLRRLAGRDATEGEGVEVHGNCPYRTNAPYSWNSSGDSCAVEGGLAIGTPSARLTARIRVSTFPSGTPRWGGYNLLGLFEPFYGTGVYVQLASGSLRWAASRAAAGRCARHSCRARGTALRCWRRRATAAPSDSC